MTNEVISPIAPAHDRATWRSASYRRDLQIGYIRHVKNFAAFVGRSPDTASADDLRRFQLHQRQNGVQASSMNSAVSGLRFFFGVTLDRPDMERHLTFVSEPRKLPVVLSPEEVARLLNAAPGLKYKAALSVAYGAGLRAAEVITRPAPIMLAHRLKQSSQICKKSAQPTSRSHSGDRQRRSALPSTAARTPYHLTGGAPNPHSASRTAPILLPRFPPLEVFGRQPPAQVARRQLRPASENLHNRRHQRAAAGGV